MPQLDLEGRLGPLPVWAWGGGIGLVVVGYMYYRSSHKAAAAAGAPMVVDGVDGAFGTANGNASGATGGAVGDSLPPGSLTPDPANLIGSLPDYSQVDFTDKTSLETWVARAVLWLSGQGASPEAAQSAISAYLSGDAQATGGDNLIQQAIAHFGPPPMGVDPNSVDLSARVKPDKPKAVAGHTWVYSDLNNLWYSVVTGKAAAPLNPGNVTMLPPKDGYAVRWNYTTMKWEYQPIGQTNPTGASRPPKPAAKPGHTWVWSDVNHVWYSVVTGASTSAKNPGNTPMLPAKAGYSQHWNYSTQKWEYTKS